jgi:hypothetical protein
MDLRSVVLFLARRFSRAHDIDNEIIAYIGTDAVGYKTVTKYLSSASFARETPDTSVLEEFKMIDEAGRNALE